MAEKISNNDYRKDVNRSDPRGTLNRGRILTPTRIPEKSPFEKLLENRQQDQEDASGETSSSGGDQTPSSAPATREAVRPLLSQQERYGREKENFQKRMQERESDRDDVKSAGPSQESSAPRAKEADRRVIARGSVSQHKGQGEGGAEGQAGSGRGGQPKKGKGSPFLPEIKEEKSLRRVSSAEAREARFSLERTLPRTEGAALLKQARTAQLLTKALVDQLVQYCRLVTRTDGDKEIDMHLHEAVFKGLRLKVSMVRGKIEATLITQSEEVRDLFQGQKADLHKALAEKGIDVRSINVIMI